MRWYRIELDAAGKVVSAIRCCRDEDTDRVFYVRASSKLNAVRSVQRRNRRLRTNRYKALGLCSCGKPRTTGELCDNCKERKRRNSARWSARQRGEEVPAAVVPARPDEPLRVVLRREILVEVRENWIEMGDSGRFSKWLKTEIDKLTKREAA